MISTAELQDKFEAGDKEKIEAGVQETLDWLDRNQMAEKDEFDAKQKELEGIVRSRWLFQSRFGFLRGRVEAEHLLALRITRRFAFETGRTRGRDVFG